MIDCCGAEDRKVRAIASIYSAAKSERERSDEEEDVAGVEEGRKVSGVLSR